MKTKLMAIVMLALLLVSSIAFVVADDDDDDRRDRFRRISDARVRVIHASPDAPNVDVLVNGNAAFENAPFKGVTDYATLRRGTYNAQVVPAGTTEPVVIDADLRLRPARDYTVIAVGKLADIEPVIVQNTPTRVGSRYAKVRFVHASPDAPAVDIAIKNGPVIFENVAFKESRRYLQVPKGEYDLEVRVAGTDTVALELNDLEFESRKIYTAVAVGLLEDESLTAILAEDKPR